MAAKDIFNRNVSEIAGVFTTDRAKLVLKGNLGVLVQSLNFNYSQNITRLYEVGSNGPNGESNVYLVGGRTQGQLAISRVVGPSGTVSYLYEQYGDVCRARENVITLMLTETDCSTGATTATNETARNSQNYYTMKNCVINNVAIGVQSQDMVIGESTTMIFTSLVSDNSGQTGASTSSAGAARSARNNQNVLV